MTQSYQNNHWERLCNLIDSSSTAVRDPLQISICLSYVITTHHVHGIKDANRETDSSHWAEIGPALGQHSQLLRVHWPESWSDLRPQKYDKSTENVDAIFILLLLL